MDERERVGRQVDACCCGNQLVILTGKCVCVCVRGSECVTVHVNNALLIHVFPLLVREETSCTCAHLMQFKKEINYTSIVSCFLLEICILRHFNLHITTPWLKKKKCLGIYEFKLLSAFFYLIFKWF